MTFQARIPPALCAIHNFIRVHDPDEIHEFENGGIDGSELEDDRGDLAEGPANFEERETAKERQEEIGNMMWRDYQLFLRRRQQASRRQ
jgi:hypothetical protein